MRFNPAHFNRFLGAGGHVTQSFMWRKAFACPCVDQYSGQGDTSCRFCAGLGRYWADEVPGQAGITIQNQQKLTAQFGSWHPGDALMTIGSDQPFYECGYYDRFRALKSTYNFSENMIHDGLERLIGSIISISRVYWIAGDGEDAEMVEGSAPTISPLGILSWPSGGEPPLGKPYSITGNRFNEYFIWAPQPSKRNVGIDGLPVKAPVRIFDVAARAG